MKRDRQNDMKADGALPPLWLLLCAATLAGCFTSGPPSCDVVLGNGGPDMGTPPPPPPPLNWSCDDSFDNDGDGFFDFPEDPSCDGPDDTETSYDQQFHASATVLLVIDNSGSMCEEQEILRDGIAQLVARLLERGSLFHLGVITTDTLNPNQSGRLVNEPIPTTPTALCPIPAPAEDCSGFGSELPKWVDESSPAPIQLARCLSEVGISGFGGETALGAARMALSSTLVNDPSANAGFLRPNSLLSIVFVGDEDDCSVCMGASCGPLPNLQANLDCSINRVNELSPVADFVGGILAISETTIVSAFLGADEDLYAAVCTDGRCDIPVSDGPVVADPGGEDNLVPICVGATTGSAAPAARIEAFTRSFSDRGREYSICEPSYATPLFDLGTEIAEGVVGDILCLDREPCLGIPLSEVVVTLSAEGSGDIVLEPSADYILEFAVQCPSGLALGWTEAFGGPPEGRSVWISYPVGQGCE